jgi:putative aldouronate transport system permease protein
VKRVYGKGGIKLGKRINKENTSSDVWFDFVNVFFVLILMIAFIYPLYFVVIASFSDSGAVWNGEVVLLPARPSLEGYKEIIKYTAIWRGYLNSIIYTVVGVAVNLFVTITSAYALSRKEFMLRGIIMKVFTFTMFFGGGLIPTYLLIKNMGLLDSMWVLILPSAASVTNIITTRTFFQGNIPDELKEAAFLDGCTNISFLIRIVLPLSKAIIAVMALYYGVGHWNSYFGAMIYLSTRSKLPLQLILREILLKTTTIFETAGDEATIALQVRLGEVIKYCAIILSSLPALLIYPFVQKSFIKGVMIGSIKG